MKHIQNLCGKYMVFCNYNVDRALDTGVLVTGALTSNAVSVGIMYTTTQTRKETRKQPHLFIVTYINYYHVIFNYSLTLRRLMSYIYGAPILDVSRSHTTTQHSR